ncbi:MAG TPA: DNA-binding protein [Quisquiliibacterium sp.]|nr:DNA-binding protein [Quisquiliibacterium sp.]
MQDNQIAADIEALRERCPDTRALYREVCALLFFRYGITPTANRLYQYVRKGSMSTPAQVLSAFWDDLRERTRVRIDHPDLPDDLRELAGELVLQLWGRARSSAEQTLAAQAARSDDAVAAARAAAEAAAARADRAQAELESTRALLSQAESALERSRAEAADSGRELATIRGRLASMTEMLVDQGEEMRQLRSELALAQRDVARAIGEANALRVQLALARRRGSRRPLGGVPQDPDPGQEDLGLDGAAGSEGGEGE